MLGITDVAEEMEELLIIEDEGKIELLTIDDGTRELVTMDELAIVLLKELTLVVVVEEEIKLEVVAIVLDSIVVVGSLEVVVVGAIEDVVVGTGDSEEEEMMVVGATVVLDVVGSAELVVGAFVVVVVGFNELEGSTELEVGTGAAVVVVGSAELEGLTELEEGATGVVVVGSAEDVAVVFSADLVVLVMDSGVVEVDASVVAAGVVLGSSEEEATDSLVLDVCFSSEDVVMGASDEDVGCLVELLVLFPVVGSADVVDAA